MMKKDSIFRRIKGWWYLNRPRITTAAKIENELFNLAIQLDKVTTKETVERHKRILFSLKELRKNTWDIERVDRLIKQFEELLKWEEKTVNQ